MIMKATRLIPALLAASSLPLPAVDLVGGSDGTYGPLDVPSNTTLPVPAGGVFNCTTITIASGATLTFTPNAANDPVYLLATGDVTIAGTIDVSGKRGTSNAAGAGGPGGFAGGSPRIGELTWGWGEGPGGAFFKEVAAFGGVGSGTAQVYGNAALIPLVGGSGGGPVDNGGPIGTSIEGGGGGGGAILIGSNTRIDILGTGRIFANGDRNASGGGIRLVSPVIASSGRIEARAGGLGGGRIRIDARDRTAFSTIPQVGNGTVSHGAYMVARLPNPPTLEVLDVGGLGAGPGLEFAFDQPVSQPITVRATNFNAMVPVEVVAKPQHGDPVVVTDMIDNTGPSPSAEKTINIDIPANVPVTVEVFKR